MTKAKFISRLVVEDVQVVSDRDYIEYYQHQPACPIKWSDTVMLLEHEQTVKRLVAPINHISGTGRKDVFIAYSEEVEELLGIPIRAILKRVEVAESATKQERDIARKALWNLHLFETMGFIDRLFFLFNPKRVTETK